MDDDQKRTANLTLKGDLTLVIALVIPAIGLGIVLLLWLNYPALLIIVAPLGGLAILIIYFRNSFQFPVKVSIAEDGIMLYYRYRDRMTSVKWNDVSKVSIFHEESNPFYKAPTCLLKFYKSRSSFSFKRFYVSELICDAIETKLRTRVITFTKKEV